jgi:hypothetical protein
MKSSKQLTKPKKSSYVPRNRVQAKICMYVCMYLNKEFTRHWHCTSKKVFQITVYFTSIPGLGKTEARILLGGTFFLFRGFHWITLCIFL